MEEKEEMEIIEEAEGTKGEEEDNERLRKRKCIPLNIGHTG